MYFPKFWAKVEQNKFKAWGWSDLSIDDALGAARGKAEKVAALFKAGKLSVAPYGYGDKPLREEVIRSINLENSAGKILLTRNAYGCLVMNTSNVAFIDIDKPVEYSVVTTVTNFLNGIIGNNNHHESATKLSLIDSANKWCRLYPDWGLRLYETAAGFRIMVTHDFFKPEDQSIKILSEILHGDPLYRTLCLRHKSFRARLSPKPWRCGLRAPPSRWPWENNLSENKFRDWEKTYSAQIESKATCRFIDQLGYAVINPAINEVVAVHDEATRAYLPMPLA
jgi:hypothetical protein